MGPNKYVLTISFVFLIARLAAAQQNSPVDYATVRFSRIAKAVRVDPRSEEKITMDGRLDEAAWSRAVAVTNFTQWEPKSGAPASEQTEVRFLYDEDNLYVGAICYDSEPEKILAKELKEDFQGTEGDSVAFVLDTLHDRRSGFFFQTNPAGARRDGQVSNDGDTNFDWDGVWDIRTTQTDKGWVAEFVIPFKTLRFPNTEVQEWGMNVLRRVRRRNEDAHWSPLPRRDRLQRVSMAGTLTGLEGIHQGRNFKVKPFAVAGVSNVYVPARREMRREYDYDGGFDSKYGITQQITLDTTYRTDFSQVEVDTQQVNLTRFSLLFPEKREFFLENSGNFTFGVPISQAFVAGAVSNTNNLIPFFSRRIGLSAEGTPIPLVGGGRLSGKIQTYDLGLLAMKTEKFGAAPSNTFTVGRIKRNLTAGTYVGGMFTNRDSTISGDYNRVYGADSRIRIKRIELGAYLMRSDTPGRSGNNQVRQVEAGFRGNDLSIITSFHQVQGNFNPELGFLRRSDIENTFASIGWRPRPSIPRVRNLIFSSSVNYFSTGAGVIDAREQTAQVGLIFEKSSQFTIDANRNFDRLVTPFSVSRVQIPLGDYGGQDDFVFTFSSDRSRSVAGTIKYGVGEFWHGHRTNYGPSVTLRPSRHFNLDFTLDRTKARLPRGAFVTNLAGLRLLYAFNANVFLNAYLQYDGNARQFSSNVRFNIIHHPLSDFFIVYNERHDSVSRQLLERTLLLKFTQLFNF